jgi:hypothetical protein
MQMSNEQPRYAIETQDGVVIRRGNTPFPEGAVHPAPLDYNPPRYYKIVDGQVIEKSEEEKRIVDLPAKYREYNEVLKQWEELTAEEKAAVDAAEAQAIIDEEAATQAAKSPELKRVENEFLLFCDQITGTTTHTKLGFPELKMILGQIKENNLQQFNDARDALLLIQEQAIREGGTRWWDTCTWHAEVVE